MQRIPILYFAASPLGGRGIFTADRIPKNTLIEICPVIVLPPEELPLIHGTRLHDYYFFWGEEEKECAIALGFGSLYNHSYEPNAQYRADYDDRTIEFYTLRDVKAGEEITVNYNGDPDDAGDLWF
jgi:SET domain-containing protein